MKKIVVFVACLCSVFFLASLLIIEFPAPAVNLYLGYIEKKLDVDVDLSFDNILLLKEWHFNDLKISSKTGYTLDIEKAVLYPPFFSLPKKEININCKAQNLKFHKELPLLDSVCNLISIRSLGNVTFDAMDVNITLKQDEIKMDNLKVISEGIEIFGSGTVDMRDSLIDYNLKFLFSEEITADVHDIIKLTLLKKEGPHWMSLNIRARGDYRRPHLKLKSDLLDLNIKGINIK